jgi:hypothetical protein
MALRFWNVQSELLVWVNEGPFTLNYAQRLFIILVSHNLPSLLFVEALRGYLNGLGNPTKSSIRAVRHEVENNPLNNPSLSRLARLGYRQRHAIPPTTNAERRGMPLRNQESPGREAVHCHQITTNLYIPREHFPS